MQIRYQAIRLRKGGKKYKEIEDALSVARTTICTGYKKYERADKKGIKTKNRGRKLGEFRTLNSDQGKQLKRLIQDKCPDQLTLSFVSWTHIAVQQLIRQFWSIEMPY